MLGRSLLFFHSICGLIITGNISSCTIWRWWGKWGQLIMPMQHPPLASWRNHQWEGVQARAGVQHREYRIFWEKILECTVPAHPSWRGGHTGIRRQRIADFLSLDSVPMLQGTWWICRVRVSLICLGMSRVHRYISFIFSQAVGRILQTWTTVCIPYPYPPPIPVN